MDEHVLGQVSIHDCDYQHVLLFWTELLLNSRDLSDRVTVQMRGSLWHVQPWTLRYDGDELLFSFAFVFILHLKQLSAHVQAWFPGGLVCARGPLTLRHAGYLAPHCGPQLLAVWLDDLLCSFNCDR